MNSPSKSMSAMIVFVVASLMLAGLEPAAFAALPDVPQSQEREESTPKALPNRPVIVTTSVPADTAIAQAIQNQTSRPSTSSLRTPYTPPRKQSTGKSKKWIWILAAAAGAAVTTAVLVSGGDEEEGATITLGTPTPGEPQ